MIPLGGTALIACKTPTNVISSVSLLEHIQFNQVRVSGNANFKLESNIHLPQTVLSVHDHQVILENFEERKNLNHGDYVEE